MDLVKSYDSEMEDDSSELEVVPAAEKSEEVDVIVLDSDSDDDFAIQNKNSAENKEKSISVATPEMECIILDSPVKETCIDSLAKNTCIDSSAKKTCIDSLAKNTCIDSPAKKTCTDSPMKEICIDLTSPVKETYKDIDSDKDSFVKKTHIDVGLSHSNVKDYPGIKIPEVPSALSSNSMKKIDYLNLEESDSENECDNNEKISTLMDTASVLNETPYGPEKVTNISNIINSVTKQTDKTIASNLKTDSNSSRNTPDLVQNCTLYDSAENSLLDACDKESVERFPLENNNTTSETLSCIFREDNRVIEASQKIIVCRIPKQIIQTHNAHTKVITSLSWCIPKFSYLFLSASQDGSLKIWDVYRTNSVQCIKVNSGLNAAKWSLDGGQIVAGGFEKKAFVYDVQTGRKIIQYDIYNLVTSMECHPYMEDVFLVGTRNAVLGFDVRVDTSFPIRSFFSKCEEVLDIAFLDENEFICSTNIVSHDSADRTIMAWDFASGAVLSNQIYLERYTCPSLKVHPSDSTFIAQTNGNYIAAFSTHRPYKMKDKRYTGHKVSGYGIECDISPDGKYAVSGDVDGSLYFYNYSTTSTVLVTPKRKVPTNRVKWNPVLSSTLISSTYDGQIQIWK